MLHPPSSLSSKQSSKTAPGQGRFLSSGPAILFLDIENAPNLGYVWDKYEQDVLRYKKEWFMLSFAAKWRGHQVFAKCLADYPGYVHNRTDDKHLLQDLRELLDMADIVVGHNIDKFDIRKINARLSFHGILPPSPYKTVDTVKVARKYHKFNSNKLDDLGNYLGIGRKVKTGGADLWFDCMAGDMKAWRKMVRYNKQDVVLLEKVYDHFLPWIGNHPNRGVYIGKTVCPKCGSRNLISRGFGFTNAGKHARFLCRDCGGWAQDRYSVKVGKTLKGI